MRLGPAKMVKHIETWLSESLRPVLDQLMEVGDPFL